MGAGGSWDPTPLTWAPTPYIQTPTSHMQAPTPYFQAPTRPSTAPRQMCNFAINRKLNRLNSQCVYPLRHRLKTRNIRWDCERELSLRRHRARSTKYNRLVGGAENAGLENAGVAKMQGWKTRDWKMQESEKYGKRRFQKCVSDCTDWAHRVETDSNVTAAQRWAE